MEGDARTGRGGEIKGVVSSHMNQLLFRIGCSSSQSELEHSGHKACVLIIIVKTLFVKSKLYVIRQFIMQE